MIASTMAFLVAVSVVGGVAGLLLEAGLRRMDRPTRFAWLGAMALGPSTLAVRAIAALRPQAPAAVPDWVPVVSMPTLNITPDAAAGFFGLETAAGVAWLMSAVALVWLVSRTHWTLLRERSDWESTQVLGKDVFVSTDRGPAVAGVRRPWIVLPRWVLALPESELRMVLLHEEEHMRARDTHLLAFALAVVALTAWSPVTWWQLRRLRAAMEVDCDRRVLRQAPDRRTYGSSLLNVAARASGPSLGLAAFTERSLTLKRRILAMTARTTRWTAVGGGVLVMLGLVVGVQACGVESPVGVGPTREAQPVTAPAEKAPEVLTVTSPEEGVGPGFTPYTDSPVLQNRQDAIRAMEAEYPPLLREAGIGGVVRVYAYVDTTGVVTDTRVDVPSGHQALDAAALRVVGTFRFSPALNDGEKVPVWLSLPITFATRTRLPAEESPSEKAPGASQAAPMPDGGPTFTPFTQPPAILNRMEVIKAMAEAYPTELREARIGGTVRVFFFVDADGTVGRTMVDRSSGNEALDEAALKVASVYRFSPALNKDKKVPVWVAFPLTFRVQ